MVSVIIPVYNAEKYVKKALESALLLKAVGEVIVIDDGYTDGAAEICKRLAEGNDKVSFYQHPGGANLGAGASRNLGIKKAKYDYVAFLDADDYFLPNRFDDTFRVFENNPHTDAVYEPVATFYQTEIAKEQFANWRKIQPSEALNYVTYLKKEYSGRDFLISLLKGNNDSPHLNGITFKKDLLERIHGFNEKLKLHQDSDMWIRASYHGWFSPAQNPVPVAVRRVHEENRIKTRNFKSIAERDKVLYDWAKKEVSDKTILKLVRKRYIFSSTFASMNTNNSIAKGVARLRYLF